ncbi:hypothetical protein ACFFP0_11590 [Rhizobium puerariae]|uniref:Uncharacterized protein n=1 Tax=Rhizobium puerariae TaxID=1585791 RepID=A0ABV6AFT9_9HYPH
MNIHRHTHVHHSEIRTENREQPMKPGLWKLLAAAALILLALVAAIEIFGGYNRSLMAPGSPGQTEQE